MRTRPALRTAVLLALASILTLSVSTFATAAGSPTEIKWMEWWVNEWGPDNFNRLIDNFQKANPDIKITVVDTPYPQMSGKLNAAAAAGENYDVFGTEGSWLPGLKKLGYVENLDPWLAKSKAFADTLLPTTLRKINGDTLSLCLYMIPYQFAYNVDQFAAAGLKPPANWDQFIDVEKKLHNQGANKYGMSMPLSDGGFAMTRYFGFRLAQEGGQLLDTTTGKVTFNSPAGVAAMTWWKNFYQMGLVVPGSFGEDQARMLEYVASGQVASIIDGPFIWSKSKQIDPKIKLAYAPAWRAKTGGYLWSCSGVAMSAKSPNKEAAWKFLQYLYSPATAVAMTKAISLPWATRAAMNSLNGSADPMLKYIPQFANQDAKANIVLPALPNTGTLFDLFKTTFQDAVSGKKPVKQALDEAAAAWQTSIDQSK
ncbi:MAG TPA: sugar ABC transporter substrate-binding protein [bacterium]|nr:sugar ABC transporter substrate-binding protein [bacterium]